MAAANGKLVWTGRVLSILVSLMFAMGAFMAFKGGPEVTEGMAHHGFAESVVIPLGVIEISCAVLYLFPATSVLGAILLTGYLGGAVCTHVRVGEPFLIPLAVGVLVWVGLGLREPRLRALIPFRSGAAQ